MEINIFYIKKNKLFTHDAQQHSPWGDQNQWHSRPKNWGGGIMFDIRRITLFYLEKRLSKPIFPKSFGGHGPFGSPWLRLWSKPEKYTEHTNITSNSDLCTHDRLTTQITVLMNLHLHTLNGWNLITPNILRQRWKDFLTTAVHGTCLSN